MKTDPTKDVNGREKPIFYRPTDNIRKRLERLMKDQDRKSITRILDRIICERFEADFGKEAPVAEGGRSLQLVVDLNDQIAGLDAGSICRSVIDGANDLDVAIFPSYFDAEATKFSGSGFL